MSTTNANAEWTDVLDGGEPEDTMDARTVTKKKSAGDYIYLFEDVEEEPADSVLAEIDRRLAERDLRCENDDRGLRIYLTERRVQSFRDNAAVARDFAAVELCEQALADGVESTCAWSKAIGAVEKMVNDSDAQRD